MVSNVLVRSILFAINPIVVLIWQVKSGRRINSWYKKSDLFAIKIYFYHRLRSWQQPSRSLIVDMVKMLFHQKYLFNLNRGVQFDFDYWFRSFKHRYAEILEIL